LLEVARAAQSWMETGLADRGARPRAAHCRRPVRPRRRGKGCAAPDLGGVSRYRPRRPPSPRSDAADRLIGRGLAAAIDNRSRLADAFVALLRVPVLTPKALAPRLRAALQTALLRVLQANWPGK
jgi:hypothetical protein